MKDVDVGLFDFDFDTTFSMFVMNHKEQVYLRYGGRDDRSPDSYLSIKGLNRALARGLELHEQWQSGALKLPDRPARKPARSYPPVAQQIRKNKCVHCHHIAAGVAEAKMKRPGFDLKRDVWVFPDPRRLGFTTKPDTGLELRKVEEPASAAGFKKRDVLRRVEGRVVTTFTDLQHALEKIDPGAKSLAFEVERKRGRERVTETLTLPLPEHWRVTDLNRRTAGHKIQPFPGFWARAISPRDKRKLGLKKESFAARVTKFWTKTNGQKAGLQVGDVVYAVNGVQASPLAVNVMLYIRLHHKTGEAIKVSAVRGRRRVEVSYKLRPKPW